MNQHLNPTKTGLTLGGLVGGLHVAWSILVAFGWAQALVNFSFWAHMVSLPLVVKTFDLSTAVTLVVVVTIIGYVVGHIFALIWNRVHRG
jgi:hypothetical protein